VKIQEVVNTIIYINIPLKNLGNLLRNEYFRNSSLRANFISYQLVNRTYIPNQKVPSANLIVAGIPDFGIFRRRIVAPVEEFVGTLTSNMVNVTHLLYSAKSNDGPVINPGKKKTYPK
jgi:hypothetical protein